MQRVVILGTGTAVGKTVATTALARALRRQAPGALVQALKPVETGVRRPRRSEAPPSGSDAALLEAASRGPIARPHPLHAFPRPVSPHIEARRSGTAISLARLNQWVSTALGDTTSDVSFQLIETAGGALSPLSARHTNLDLARALEPAVWVLVAPDALGVLHDVRATWLAMTSVARAPDYLVLSAARTPDAATGTNARELPRVGLPAPIVVLARGRTPEVDIAPLARALVRRARG